MTVTSPILYYFMFITPNWPWIVPKIETWQLFDEFNYKIVQMYNYGFCIVDNIKETIDIRKKFKEYHFSFFANI
jgi:hypothetical protein